MHGNRRFGRLWKQITKARSCQPFLFAQILMPIGCPSGVCRLKYGGSMQSFLRSGAAFIFFLFWAPAAWAPERAVIDAQPGVSCLAFAPSLPEGCYYDSDGVNGCPGTQKYYCWRNSALYQYDPTLPNVLTFLYDVWPSVFRSCSYNCPALGSLCSSHRLLPGQAPAGKIVQQRFHYHYYKCLGG